MAIKMNKPHLYSVDLTWTNGDQGIVHSPTARQSFSVTMPPEFGGNAEEWNPELLFLSAVTSCYMSTYLQFVRKLKFDNTGLECTATGQVELVEGKYKFTFIHIYPKVYVANESEEEKALIAMEKAKRYCLISNSINAEILHHPEVVIRNKGSKYAA